MKKYPLFLIITLLTPGLIDSCQTKTNVSLVNEFEVRFKFLKNYKWTVDYENKDEGGTVDLKAHAMLGDTTLQIILNKSFDLSGQEAYNISLSKIFKRSDSNYIKSLDEEFSLRYFYKSGEDGQKTFITGKYLYLYESNKLTLGQQQYFKTHIDSLKKIEGNDLPTLPEQ